MTTTPRSLDELDCPDARELADKAGRKARQARRLKALAAKPHIITGYLGGIGAAMLIDTGKCAHDHVHYIGALFERYPCGSVIKWTTEPVTEAFEQEAEAVLAGRLHGEQVRRELCNPIFHRTPESEQRLEEAERMPEGWEFFGPFDDVWEQLGWRTDAEQRELEQLDGTAGDE